MNKGRRNELAQLKYRKRLRKVGAPVSAIINPKGKTKHGIRYNFTGYKNHSTPCSCEFCSPRKYNRAKDKRSNRISENP